MAPEPTAAGITTGSTPVADPHQLLALPGRSAVAPALASGSFRRRVTAVAAIDPYLRQPSLAGLIDPERPEVARPCIATGRSHNVHVEDPAWVAGLIAEAVGPPRDAAAPDHHARGG